MGRKPNPIILEYFTRGAKLEDASNRYQHTCKLCGENFPKGRIDSLVVHLTKKCNSISLPERTKIVLRLHDLTDHEGSPKTDGATKLGKGKHVDLPFSPTKQQNFDGLNVLAEASRRVGNGADHQRGRRNLQAQQTAESGLPLDPALGVDGLINGGVQGFDNQESSKLSTSY